MIVGYGKIARPSRVWTPHSFGSFTSCIGQPSFGSTIMKVHKLESAQALESASEYLPSCSSSSEGVRPFKSNIVGVEYTPEGIVYSLVHVTDGFKTTAFIKDSVVMQCGCYAKLRLVRQADAAVYAAWAEL